MPDYKGMYFKLFNRLTDVSEALREIQRECEEDFMEDQEET